MKTLLKIVRENEEAVPHQILELFLRQRGEGTVYVVARKPGGSEYNVVTLYPCGDIVREQKAWKSLCRG